MERSSILSSAATPAEVDASKAKRTKRKLDQAR
jgi:hypothetical protein